MNNYVIVGGGITGLMCAYFASSAGNKVTILESGKEIGGLLSTFEIGGTPLEKFYHHFFTHDSEILWLIKKLGIENNLRFHDSTMGIFSGNKMYDFNSVIDLLKFEQLGIADKIRFGLTSLYLGNKDDWEMNENEAIFDWFNKYAGTTVTDIIWKPLLKVKFGPYYNKVPVSWMIGRMSQRLKSRKAGKEKLGYIKGSLKVLLEALLKHLLANNVEIKTRHPVLKINADDSKILNVETPSGTVGNPEDKFIFTIPTNFLGDLFSEINKPYAVNLKQIEYFGAMCLILETSRPLSNIYWLNVASEGFDFGGVIEHTNIMPPQEYGNTHITYLSRYFSANDPISNLSKIDLENLMLTQLKKIFPNLKDSEIKNTHLFRTNTAATVCDLNFSKRVIKIKSPYRNMSLASMPHIYPDERSCNNSIRVAANVCSELGIDTSAVPKGRSLSGQIGINYEKNYI